MGPANGAAGIEFRDWGRSCSYPLAGGSRAARRIRCAPWASPALSFLWIGDGRLLRANLFDGGAQSSIACSETVNVRTFTASVKWTIDDTSRRHRSASPTGRAFSLPPKLGKQGYDPFRHNRLESMSLSSHNPERSKRRRRRGLARDAGQRRIVVLNKVVQSMPNPPRPRLHPLDATKTISGTKKSWPGVYSGGKRRIGMANGPPDAG